MADETAQMIPTPSFAEKKRDRRLAALVDSAVHQAMEEYGRIEADTRPEQAAYDIARSAVTLALTTAFNDDAELKYTREMLEKVIATTLRGFELLPAQSIWTTGPANAD